MSGQAVPRSPSAVPVRHVEHCMGTVFSFDVRSPGVDRTGLTRAVAWLHEVDATYSPFRADSTVGRVRAGTLPVRHVPDAVARVLERGAELNALTDGYFSAYFDGELDPSGYVKGWAIEVASDILAAAGSLNHCVNGGGDVQCVGEAAPGRPWRVGISDPFDASRLIDTIEGSGRLAVATSGVAERGSHIADPHTRQAPVGLSSVTVAGSDLALVDAVATAAFAMGSAGPQWLARHASMTSVVTQTDGHIVRAGSARGHAPGRAAVTRA